MERLSKPQGSLFSVEMVFEGVRYVSHYFDSGVLRTWREGDSRAVNKLYWKVIDGVVVFGDDKAMMARDLVDAQRAYQAYINKLIVE